MPCEYSMQLDHPCGAINARYKEHLICFTVHVHRLSFLMVKMYTVQLCVMGITVTSWCIDWQYPHVHAWQFSIVGHKYGGMWKAKLQIVIEDYLDAVSHESPCMYAFLHWVTILGHSGVLARSLLGVAEGEYKCIRMRVSNCTVYTAQSCQLCHFAVELCKLLSNSAKQNMYMQE